MYKEEKEGGEKETLDRRETGMRPKIIQPLLSPKVVKVGGFGRKKRKQKIEKRGNRQLRCENEREKYFVRQKKKREAGKEFKAPPTKKEKGQKFPCLTDAEKRAWFPDFCVVLFCFSVSEIVTFSRRRFSFPFSVGFPKRNRDGKWNKRRAVFIGCSSDRTVEALGQKTFRRCQN